MSVPRPQLRAILHPGFEVLDTFGALELFTVLGASAVRINTVDEAAGPVPPRSRPTAARAGGDRAVRDPDPTDAPFAGELNGLSREPGLV